MEGACAMEVDGEDLVPGPSTNGPCSEEQRFLWGKKLVEHVMDHMMKSKEKETNSAWNANLDIKTKSIFAEVGTGKPGSTWNYLPMNTPTPVFPNPKDMKKNVKVQPIVIPPVHANPPMTNWIESRINYPVSDSKALTHLPFMGDDESKRRRNDKFGEQLLEMYDGKLHPDDTTPLEDDGIDLINFIRVLMEVNKRYGDGIFLEEKPRVSAKKVRRIYKQLDIADEKAYNLQRPSETLLKAVCDCVDPDWNLNPDKLRSRYVKLCQKRDPEFGKVKNIMPQNVDAPKSKTAVFSKSEQMDSYKSLFCRFCFVYSCPKHPALMTTEEASTYSEVAKLDRSKNFTSTGRKTKGIRPIIQEKGRIVSCSFTSNCWKKADSKDTSKFKSIGKDPETAWYDLLVEWSAVERTMFNCMYETFEDYCIVAALIGTKSCRQVKEYHQLQEIILRRNNNKHLQVSKTAPGNNATTPDCEIPPATPGSSGYESSCSPSGASAKDDQDKDLSNDYDNIQELCTFTPCFHSDGKCTDTCPCIAANKQCESTCGCLKTCKNRFKGCTCRTTCDTKMCPCYIQNRECDPDLCKGCGAHENVLELKLNPDKKVTCKNIVVQQRRGKRIYLGKSNVSGWGAFAENPIQKGEFVIEYTGELISSDEAEKRGHIYDERFHTYLFGLNDNLVLDAMHMGTISKFINSSKRPNCQAIKVNVRGETRLAIRAVRGIQKDEELFIDYHEIIQPKKKNSTKKSKKYATE